MAKAKSSQQEDLTTSKTGIDMTFGLGFGTKKEEAPKAPETKIEDVKVDKKVEKVVEPENNQVEQPNSPQLEEKTEVAEKPVKSKVSAKKTAKSTSSKLKKPETIETDDTIIKISALISSRAKANLDKYAKMYGYKKLSPFINDLLEHLDAYMDEEE